MGNETSRAPRLMPSRDELDNILDQSLHQSIKLDDQYDDIHSILLASSTYHQAINQSKSPTVYQDYVGPLIHSIDDFLADSSIRSLHQSHHQSIKLPVFDLPKNTPINSLAALATDVYAADHNANSRDASSINASISMQSDQSPTYQSCRERISLARKYLILQAIIKQSTKASVQLIKSNLRTNNQSFQAKSRNSIGGAPTNQSNAQFMSLLSKVERARQSVEWLMRDLAINQAIHQAHEMMRILVGIHSHTLYSYPRALGIVSSNKPINRSSVTPASNITRPSPGSPISFHNHVTFTFGVPSTQPTSPTSKSNIHVPFTSASLSSINSPISTSHQGAHLPQYWIEQLNQRIASLDRAAQTNELVALLGALNGGLDDTFVVSLDNLSINLSNNQSIHQSIQESGMSARLSGLLSLSHRRSLNTSDFRRALINMINRYTTINQAINQLQVETVKLYNESINHSNRSSTYNHSIFQAINRNQRQINQMLAESMIEKRAMRDLFKFFHQSVAQFIVSDLSQAINQSANQPINHSINLSTLYSDLQRVDRACSNLFGSINQSEVPPITFSLSGGLGRNSSSHVGHSANIPDASPAQVTVHYDRERHAAFEEFADDKRLPHPLLDFDDDCKEIFEMKSNRSLHNDAGFRLDKVRSRSPSADQLPSVEEIARINNYRVMGQQPAASSFEEKEQHDELKESYSHPVEQKPLPAVVESVLLDSQPINQQINQPVNLPVNQSSSYVEPTRRPLQPHSRLDLPSFEEPVVHEAPSEAAPLNLDVEEPTAQSVSEPAAVEPVPEAVQSPVTDAVLPPVLPPRPSLKALSIVSSPPLHQAVEAQSHNRSFSSPTALSITRIPLDSPRPLPPIPPRGISNKSIGVQKVVVDQPESVDRPVTASPDQPSVEVMSNHVSQQNPSPSSQIGSRYHTPQPIDTERDAIESTNHAATHPSNFLPPLIVSSSEMEPHHSINGSSHLDISPVSQDHQSFGQSLNYSAHHSEMMQDPVSYGSLSPQIEDDDHIHEPVEAPVQPIAKPAIAPMFPPPRPALVLSEIPRSIHSRLTDQSCNQSIKQPINSPVKIPVFSPVRPALPAELASRFIQPNRQSVGQSNGEEKVLGHEHSANSNKQSTHQSMYSPSSINWDLSPATKQMLARSNAIENVKPSNKPSAAVSPLTDNSKHHPAELSINQSNTSSSNQPKFFPPAPTPVSHYNQILHTASRRQSFDEV